jgi:hypothetical protein
MQELQERGQMREMSRNQHIASLSSKPIADPHWGILRLQIAGCRELGKRVTGSPERFCRLSGPQLAAVPDHSWPSSARRGSSRGPLNRLLPAFRKGPTGIDVGTDGLTVMNEIQIHDRHTPSRRPKS